MSFSVQEFNERQKHHYEPWRVKGAIKYYPGTSIPMPQIDKSESKELDEKCADPTGFLSQNENRMVNPDVMRNPMEDNTIIRPDFYKLKGLVKREHYLTVNSIDRDRTAYPNPNYYSIKFIDNDDVNRHVIGKNFKNVIKIELISAIYPNKNNILSEMYLNLIIDEIDPNIYSNNNTTSKAFTRLVPDSIVGNFVHGLIDGIDYRKKIYRYGNILQSLNKMTIEIRDNNNNLFNFGTDSTPPTLPDKTLQNSFSFCITTLEPDTSKLNSIAS